MSERTLKFKVSPSFYQSFGWNIIVPFLKNVSMCTWKPCRSSYCEFLQDFWVKLIYLLGHPTIFWNLTDSPKNQGVFLLVFQINKSKISEKSNENWSCYKLRTNSFSPRQPAGQIWWLSSQAGQNCSTFSFGRILLKFWI